MNPMLEKLTLCGVNHIDFEGPYRLVSLLEREMPDVVSVEYSQRYFECMVGLHDGITSGDRRARKRALRFLPSGNLERLNQNSLECFLRIRGYDAWIPWAYALEYGKRVECVEPEEVFSDEETAEVNRLMGEEFAELLKYSPDAIQRFIDFNYRCRDPLSEYDPAKTLERNRRMSPKIAGLQGNVLHVSGAEHIFGESPNLFDLLREYNPRRVLLLNCWR